MYTCGASYCDIIALSYLLYYTILAFSRATVRAIPRRGRGGGEGVWRLDAFRVREWDGTNRDFFSLGWQAGEGMSY